MADSVSLSLKKALPLVQTLSLKLVLIHSTCRVVRYASRKNKALFMQVIDHGIYKMDKNDKICVLLDDNEQLGTPKGTSKEKSNVESVEGDEDIDDSCNGGDSVVVDLNNDPSDNDLARNGYCYTGKLFFICFGPTTGKFYSPILSTGGSINQGKEEKKKGGRARMCVCVC